MKIGELIDASSSSLFKQPEKRSNELGQIVYDVCGEIMQPIELENLARSLGWLDHFLPTDELFEIEGKYAKAFKKYLTNNKLANCEITFQNCRGNDYGTTYNRVFIQDNYNGRTLTIIDGMKSAGGRYVVYLNKRHIYSAKASSMKGLVEYIDRWA